MQKALNNIPYKVTTFSEKSFVYYNLISTFAMSKKTPKAYDKTR